MICWKKLACDYDEKLREHEEAGKALDPNMFVMNYVVHDEFGNPIEDSQEEDLFNHDMQGRDMEIIDGKNFTDNINDHINNQEMYRSGAKANPTIEPKSNNKIQVKKVNVKSKFKDELGQNSKSKEKLAIITENTEHGGPSKKDSYNIDKQPDDDEKVESPTDIVKNQGSLGEISQGDYQINKIVDSKVTSNDNLQDSQGLQLSKLNDNLGDSKVADINGNSDSQTLKKDVEGQDSSKTAQNGLSKNTKK